MYLLHEYIDVAVVEVVGVILFEFTFYMCDKFECSILLHMCSLLDT